MDTDLLFQISTTEKFTEKALKTFRFQFENNPIYNTFCNHLDRNPRNVHSLQQIPYLPVEFFKSHKVVCGDFVPEIIFTSSGTTGAQTSKHEVHRLALYKKSFELGFHHFYGPTSDYCILALLPSYLEREGSSLIYMVSQLITSSKHPKSGFYLNDLNALKDTLLQLEATQTKTLLIGVSFALLDLAEQYPVALKNTIVMETGGMKGRRKELIREALHHPLKKAFGVPRIHSEYGMTELLSQAYSKGNGIFYTPPWMNVFIRDTEDPLSFIAEGKTGGLNIIDLANYYSCSFIATQDLGKLHPDGSFEVLGRFDHSDIRGCNLMVL
ncbi:acyl transferase [Arenibacter sp. GZD96]|uniref:hypothetical protein n=1 Tax=Aurantibrevibacter litoralis TaxID=3106030 RepID=UPI002AFF54F2|nr:hypothetical protein [Arenibacter sp. GZD-96]MEA1787155.1 acyl transferase [Arenibacter sp. GZD-96]